jgi:hypothetical protein
LIHHQCTKPDSICWKKACVRPTNARTNAWARPEDDGRVLVVECVDELAEQSKVDKDGKERCSIFGNGAADQHDEDFAKMHINSVSAQRPGKAAIYEAAQYTASSSESCPAAFHMVVEIRNRAHEQLSICHMIKGGQCKREGLGSAND